MAESVGEQVPTLLLQAARSVCRFLEGILPTISASWWSELVVPNLSFQHRRSLESRRVSELSGLDLAALLRVLDANWHNIADRLTLPNEARHYLKDMRTVQERWAHAVASDYSPVDIYHDLDTLQRFLIHIGGDEELLGELKLLKNAALGAVSPKAPEPGIAKQSAITAFVMGQLVGIRSSPGTTGAVVGVQAGHPETRYSIFQKGEVVTYYESQLHAVDRQDEVAIISLGELEAYLSALLVRHPSTSLLYSLNTARIDCVPYQFRPVLKLIRAERPRLLLADGVGVGKTIEAGLILKELQARTDIQRVLVICPKPLIAERKWESEMRRFDERFSPLDGDKLRYCLHETDLDGVWPEQYAKAILPYSLLDEELLFGSQDGARRRRMGLVDLSPFPRFDLVIVDEAQHVRNPETFAHRCVRLFCEHAEAVLLLTATPLEMSRVDLYVLLNLLRPDLVRDIHTFEMMTAPNPFLNEAAALVRSARGGWQAAAREQIEQAVQTPWGAHTIQNDPMLTAVLETLGKSEVTQRERIECLHRIEQLHTLFGIINRTRRRDIGNFTVRKPETRITEFTPAQRQLHDGLLATQALILMTLHPTANVKFLMTMIRRQAASCLYGLVPLLREILTRHLGELRCVEAGTPEFDSSVTIDAVIETKIKKIFHQAEALDPYDPKLEALIQVVREKIAMPNRRLMVFSSFRHTLAYLFAALEREGLRVGLVHGDVPDEERKETRRRFQLEAEHPEAIDVLLFSEVGSEGLDYQFCDCIVNYDLPWNPQRIEQRIGRIDRRGQKSEKVRIINLITPGTVDADIYERCLLRIGIFEREIGASDEILGQITRELQSIAEDFTLTDEERREKLRQLADNEVRLIREEQELEERQAELFALRIPTERAESELRAASSRWLSPALLENLVRRYLATLDGEPGGLLGEKSVKTLRLKQETRNALLADFAKLPRSTAVTHREWEQWLKGSNPHLRVTFEQAAAAENPEVTLLSPVHPLVRQAAMSMGRRERAVAGCRVRSKTVPPGDYPFAVYQWRFAGLQEESQLQPVALDERIRAEFAEFLSHAEPLALEPAQIPSAEVIEQLERIHYGLWCAARERYRDETARRAAFRLASLESSYSARIAQLQDQLAKATDERIHRMHQAQLDRAAADRQRRVDEIARAKDTADLQAQLIAFGVIQVIPG